MRHHLTKLSAAIILIGAVFAPLRATAMEEAHVWFLWADVEYTLVDDDWGSADTTRLATSHQTIGYNTEHFELIPLTWDPHLCAGEEVRGDVRVLIGADPVDERLVARVDIKLFEGETCDTDELEESERRFGEVPLQLDEGATTEGRLVVSVCRGGCPESGHLGPHDDTDRVDVVVVYRARKVPWHRTHGWWRYIGTTKITVRDNETYGSDDITEVEIGSSVLLDPDFDWTTFRPMPYPGLTGHVCAGDEAVARIDATEVRLSVDVAEGDECDPSGEFREDAFESWGLTDFFEEFFADGVHDTLRTLETYPFRRVTAREYSKFFGVPDLDVEATVLETMDFVIETPGIDEYGNRVQHVRRFDMRRQRPPVTIDVRTLDDQQVVVPRPSILDGIGW